MLYIVSKSPHSSSRNAPPKPSKKFEFNNPTHSFTAEVGVKGPGLYEMALQEPSNYLRCNLLLEVEESDQEYEGRTVICYFPTLSVEELFDFIEEDETLYSVLMIQFLIKILEQLFLFCATHYASTLIIFADNEQADDLGIYQDFLAHKDQALTSGEKTEMIIPANRETFDAWVNFMGEITVDSRRTLWRNQGSSPIIKRYLKNHSLG